MKKNILYIFILLFILYILIIKNNSITKELFFSNNKDNITIVCGYWDVHNKHGKDQYNKWFENALSINARYIFFCDKSDIDYIKSFRKNYNTVFIEYPTNNFYSQQFYDEKWFDPTHIPSAKLGMIWHEKINLIKLAKEYDGENATDFYIWIDAGMYIYREKKPPEKYLKLIDTNSLVNDKFSYSTVDEEIMGGCLILPKNVINKFHTIYYDYLSKCNILSNNNVLCGKEQYVLTLMKKDNPDLFNKMGDGYGANLLELYNLC